MIVPAAPRQTVERVLVGIRESRSRLRMAKVEGGYRLGGQTGRDARGRLGSDLILFGPVRSLPDTIAEGVAQHGHRPVLWRQ